MDLSFLGADFQRRFDAVMAAREVALASSRQAIRSSANSIRATHRGEAEEAERLMDEARAALDRGTEATAEQPSIRYGGYLQDAEKEYAEARLTAALLAGDDLPGPDELRVGLAPYLNGMAEAAGEARRAILDRLRRGEVAESERLLEAMEEIFYLLASVDYPDAITGNLRRSTDVTRSLLEKTRGDLTMSLVQRDLHDALERGEREGR
ncbi:MAG: haloacid dehalogenase [Actinomycetota bacterium]